MVTAISDDLFAPGVIADPYPYFGQLREEDPVHWNEKYGVWILTRYEDVVWLTRHHETFSSETFKRDPRPPYPAIDEEDQPIYEFIKAFQIDRFIQHDRPAHFDMRMVLAKYFTPKSMESWRPLVRNAIRYLVDAAQAKGHMDVMRDFAIPLPLLVIAQMMGVPEEDRPYIRSLAEKLLFLNRGEPDRMRTYSEGAAGIKEYIDPLIQQRLAEPGEDLLSVLAEGERDGVYNRDQVLANAALLLVAGHETTINLICNGTLAFIRNPDQWDALRQDPEAVTQRATEECLRYDSSVKSIQRIAAEDVEMRGKVINKDDRVRWFITAANRDPRKFDEADTFDINRWPNPHVAFGGGIHHCLGVNLARLEGQEAFMGLAQRFSRFHLETDGLEYQPTINLRSLKKLPVTWD